MTKEMIINCHEDNEFEQDRQILHSCNGIFPLESSNVFYVESLGYFDDIIGQYYTICPQCGYFVLLEESTLSDELKISAQDSYKSDPYQYRKNSLRSQLIHLENKPPRVIAKVRAKTFY